MNLIFALIIVLINISIVLFITFTVYLILFIPKEKKYLFGKKVPFTPALAYRMKDKLMRFLEDKYSDYLYGFKNIDDVKSDSIARKWKIAILDFYESNLALRNYFNFIPGFLVEGADNIIHSFLSEFITQLFKDFIPYLVEKYKVHKYIDVVDMKVDVDVFSGYFYKYYKYVLIFGLVIGFLIGLFNAILFLIFA